MSTLRKKITQFYNALNRMLAGNPEPFLALWSQGKEVTLMLSLGEREKGINSITKICRQVASVLGESPARIKVKAKEYQVREEGKLAYAVVMEQSITMIDGREAESLNRSTLIFHFEDNDWKVVHVHNDNVTPVQETLSYILRHKNFLAAPPARPAPAKKSAVAKVAMAKKPVAKAAPRKR
ncbi:MAG: nuclear transport factor 2 family protein [Vulcanimicrobiota bacterium]